MKLVNVCSRCGGKLNKLGDLYVCDYCNASFEEKKAIDITEELNKLLDQEKQERIAFIRRRLWEAIHEKYIDSEKIVSISREIRNYLPNDFLACFFEKVNSSNDKQDIVNYLNNINCKINYDDIDVILDFIIKSLEEPYILPINNIIEKTYKNRDLELYNKYISYLEDEAEKLNSLLYELNITRDVFIAYSSKDMKYVNELAQCFDDNGISYFIAAKNLRHGKGAVQNYDEALKLAIRNSNVIVFVSTENSRKRDCDAISKELPWIKYLDLDKAPVEYRNNYQKLPSKYKKPRVELLIDNYKGTPIEQITKEFFDGNEWCYSKEDVVTRVLKLLTEEVVVDDYVNQKEIRQNEVIDKKSKISEGLEYECNESGDYIVKGIGTCTDEDIVIPAVYNNKPVVAIAESAFRRCDNILSVIFSEGIQEIGAYSFYECTFLKLVDIPKTVVKIGKRAFGNCNSLKEVILEEGIKTITNSAFEQCDGFDYIKIPSTVTVIEEHAFHSCTSLKKIKLSDKIEKIGTNAFANCPAVENIVVDENNKYYDTRYSCNAIIEKATSKLITGCKNTLIPNDITTIGESAFSCCRELRKIVITNNITTIENFAFYRCEGLNKIFIPKSVKRMGKFVFDFKEIELLCEMPKPLFKNQPSGWDPDWNAYMVYFEKASTGHIKAKWGVKH